MAGTGPVGPPSRLGARDLLSEAVAGVLQRPGRSALTTLGTVLGIGAFVAVLGLTATASGQIGARFDQARATTVTATDHPVTDGVPPGANPPTGFPADSDARAGRIDGVTAAGLWWRIPSDDLRISTAPAAGPGVQGLALFAATPGAVAAMHPTLAAGVTLDPYAQSAALPVVLLSRTAATRLGVTRLDAQPAIFIQGLPYTVIGVYDQVERLPDTLLGVIVPGSTALERFGNPGTGGDEAAHLLAATRAGAADVVAGQLAVALRPDAPDLLTVNAPPDPHSLRDRVTSDLTGLFLALAAICLVVGAVGIANTTLVAVLERTPEIGLRRSLGARTRHIAAQFLTESTALGTLGGLIGTCLGVLTVLAVAAARDWTAVLQPWATLPAPLIGSAVGLLAGLYPAVRAARTDPLTALRGG
ncbi:putative ABC transport system permease protein [Streptomyces sp. TLI_235]|nr:ABC transporter permease [Streptomyces sp. TLI_235]PBC78671.1 putative ABC transport system permease protein [Streptomyces sp. TLI_235]